MYDTIVCFSELFIGAMLFCTSVDGEVFVRDAQAKLALIVAQIYPSVHPSVHLCVCPRQLESTELSIAANFVARRLSAFFLN